MVKCSRLNEEGKNTKVIGPNFLIEFNLSYFNLALTSPDLAPPNQNKKKLGSKPHPCLCPTDDITIRMRICRPSSPSALRLWSLLFGSKQGQVAAHGHAVRRPPRRGHVTNNLSGYLPEKVSESAASPPRRPARTDASSRDRLRNPPPRSLSKSSSLSALRRHLRNAVPARSVTPHHGVCTQKSLRFLFIPPAKTKRCNVYENM